MSERSVFHADSHNLSKEVVRMKEEERRGDVEAEERDKTLLTADIRNVQLYWYQCKHISIEINRAALKLILVSNKRMVPGSLMELP